MGFDGRASTIARRSAVAAIDPAQGDVDDAAHHPGLQQFVGRMGHSPARREQARDLGADGPQRRPGKRVVPDGDLFRAIRKGRAEVVTDHIERFTERGILLQSGRALEADVVVLAAGLQLQAVVDGKPFYPSAAMSYKGMMLSDMPNSVIPSATPTPRGR